MRLIICLALLAIAPAEPATKSDDAGSQFIDKSIVTYPTSLGHYRLKSEFYDPTNVPNGISLDYELADAPGKLQFNIYVYPLGRADTDKAVADAVVEMEGEIRQLEQRKSYSDVKFNDAIAFDVAVPPPSILKSDDNADSAAADAADAKSSSSSTEPTDPALVDALKMLEPATKTTGSKHALTMMVGDQPSQSLAYVFYRNLFLISVRATAPSSSMPTDQFNALVDQAVQDLVPAMEIENFGSCGTISISLDSKTGNEDKDASAGAIQIVREMGRVAWENCANKPGPETPLPEGRQQQAIVYPAGMWK